jgi:Mitochondrial carrier protein
MWAKQTPRILSAGNDGAAHFQCALRLRGGSSSAPSFSYAASSTRKPMISAAATSLLAGSLAGAVGVGVAFPLDTLKTKAQVMETETKLSMTQVIRVVYKQDGIKGFFGGVKGMMLGQAVIKSVAFGCNSMFLAFLQQQFPNVAPAVLLITAACLAGFVTSFFVTPVERVKVMMQASGTYANEIDCLKAILRREGWAGLFGRGLGPTLIRETPSYGIYFFIYGYLMQTPLAAALGGIAPLVFGAVSGCACWIPVYPVSGMRSD